MRLTDACALRRGADLSEEVSLGRGELLRLVEDLDGRLELKIEVMPRGVASGYPGWDALRTPRWRFIRWQTGRRELYDLEADPWELENRVREEASLAAMLEARLNELVAASGGIPPAVPDRPAVSPTDRCGIVASRRPVVC